MLPAMVPGWTLLDSDTHTLTAEYEFRPGSQARSLATRFDADELLVISPPVGLSDEENEKLREHGKVTAIVAPNGMHYLGVRSLLDAYPDARVYAPASAAQRISKKKPGFDIQPLAELTERAKGAARVWDVPGFSIGETWVTVATGSGPIWYVSDSCFNMPELPKSFLVGRLMKWTSTAPGLRMNGIGNLFFLKDRAAYRRWFDERLEEETPNVLVPAHGAVYSDPDLGSALRSQVDTRL